MWKRVYDWPARHRIQKTIKFDGICTRAGRKRKNVPRIKQPAGRKVLFGGKKWNVTRRRFLSADHHPIGDSGPIFYRLRPLPHILSGGHRNFPLSSLFPRFSSFPASSQALIPLFFSLSLPLPRLSIFISLAALISPSISFSRPREKFARELDPRVTLSFRHDDGRCPRDNVSPTKRRFLSVPPTILSPTVGGRSRLCVFHSAARSFDSASRYVMKQDEESAGGSLSRKGFYAVSY